MVPELELDTLLQIAAFFDPSRETFKEISSAQKPQRASISNIFLKNVDEVVC